MVNIAIAGAAGRMGQRITALSLEMDTLKLTGAFDRAEHADIGKDMGGILGIDPLGVKLVDSIGDAIGSADVIIDFTHPDVTVANAEIAAKAGCAMVTGTTGLTKEHQAKLKELSADIPIVFAFNMSLGINVLTKIVGDVARALGDDYDVEIIEAHHKLKKDAPSGTAFMLANAASDALGRNLDDDGVFSRHGMIGERKDKEIGIQTIRGGDIVGEHTVMFCGMGERIEITHKVSNRDTFARGALRAASWLKGKPLGLYDMQDVLGLK